MRWLLVPVILSFWSSFALANDIQGLIRTTAAELDVPAPIVGAIAHVESGASPWTLNIEGKGYSFPDKAAALAAAHRAQATGKSFDSGVMQVNSQWLDRFNIPLDAALDPEANIYLGSRILQQEIQRHGPGWQAVARYHSPNPERGNRYVALVKAALDKKMPTEAVVSRPGRSEPKELTAEVTPPALVVYRGSDRTVFTRQPAMESEESGLTFVRRMNR
ncbi:MAG: lytic transglycosylase domain-containing protein [Desulfobulbus sp.]|jgi:hypothetical protein